MGLDPFTIMGIIVASCSGFINYMKQQSAKKAAATAQRRAEASMRGKQIEYQDSQAVIPLVYGTFRLGVNKVYMSTTGDNNTYLHIVGVICEGEIEGFEQVGGVDCLYLDDKLYNQYGGMVYYELFTGSPTQTVCATLQTATAGEPYPWTDPLKNTAYIYVRLTYNDNYFQQPPNISVTVKGLKIFDTRTSTTAYSANPALCVYDILTRSGRRGGMGIAAARIDTTTVDSAANYCDTEGFNCNIALMDENPLVDDLEALLDTFRGDCIYTATKFKIVYKDLDDESTVMDLTEQDIEETGGKSSLRIIQPSIFDTPNAVRIRYPHIDNRYMMNDYVLSDSTAITADGDYREQVFTLPGTVESSSIQKLANYYLERARINKTISFTGPSRLLALEPNDIVTVTHSFPGWSQKYFRVEGVSYQVAGNVAISAVEESSLFYNDTFDLAGYTFHDTTIPGLTAPGNVLNLTATEETYDYADRTFTRLKIDFDPPDSTLFPWWSHGKVWMSIDGTATWKQIGTATTDFIIDPVEEGIEYDIKVQSVSVFGVEEDFSTAAWVNHSVVGKTAAPSAPESISVVAAGDIVSILTEEITDPDVLGYEVRMGNTWEGGIYIGLFRGAQIRLGGMRPGDFTFWLAPKNNRGAYSATKRSGAVTVYRPSGYTVRDTTWSWDYSAGVHSNTTNSTYNSTVILKCSHDVTAADPKTGTWISPIYDLTSSITVRTWGNFLSAFIGSSASWAALPSSNTWTSIESSNKRWYEVVNQSQAGVLKSTIRWGDSTDALDNSAQMFQVCAPEFTARYCQIDVTITDPDVLSNLYLYKMQMTAAYWST